MIDSEFNAPSSEKTLYKNEFVNATPAEHQEMLKNAKKPPVVTDTHDLMPSHAGDPHQTYGVQIGGMCTTMWPASPPFLANPTWPRESSLLVLR